MRVSKQIGENLSHSIEKKSYRIPHHFLGISASNKSLKFIETKTLIKPKMKEFNADYSV